MKQILTVVSLIVLMTVSLSAADRFDRAAKIEADTTGVGGFVGGFGMVISGVDIDGDGLLEIYAPNNDWHDVVGKDLVPKIIKYEQDGAGGWNEVWSTPLPNLDRQNTWPALAIADLDNDGKQEIVWGPVNNTNVFVQNPARLVVYETPGGGEDWMGFPEIDGSFRPNSSWTIRPAASNQEELRPVKWLIHDIDNDGTDEVVTALRADGVNGHGMEIYSVDDIPDAADSTETWTIEFSGLSGTH